MFFEHYFTFLGNFIPAEELVKPEPEEDTTPFLMVVSEMTQNQWETTEDHSQKQPSTEEKVEDKKKVEETKIDSEKPITTSEPRIDEPKVLVGIS